MRPIMNEILSNGSTEKRLYWDIQLDQDLLDTIVNIYPEWFKENTLNTMTEESDSSLMPFLQPMESGAGSPPVDDQSLRNTMDKNKESLKVKLMLRRPINQLIDQGILPSLRSSAGFHEQRQKLERAKTGDFLKHKIQRRPQRQELIEQHILEDTVVDPSLHEKQRQLKKARLADDLNDRLSHRPGPLELIKGNILHTDEPFEQAVKEGQIPFKKTSEGEIVKHPPPRFVFTNEEESSSDSASSPLINSNDQSLSGLITFEASPTDLSNTTTVVANSDPPTTVSYIVSSPVTSIFTSPSTVHSILIGNGNAVAIAAPNPTPSVVAVTSGTTTPLINGTPFSQTSNQLTVNPSVVSNFKEHSSGSKCRKKNKSKAQPKARTIKFHEYKGPPNAKNQPNASQSSAESSYELLLQQQQLFLQWQLEWQQKYPQIILPTTQKTLSDQSQDQGTDAQNGNQMNSKCVTTQIALKNSFQSKPNNQSVTNNDSNGSIGSPRDRSNSNASTTQSKFNSSVVGKIISKLEDMKVSDLKAELKKRNLPVSGAKQQLIDRLKPFADAVVATAAANSSFITMNSMNSENNDSKVINGDGIKTEPNSDSMVMSPTIDSNSNDVKTEQMDIKSPENDVMEVDSIVEDVDQNCSMDLGNECLVANNTNQTNDDIVLIQQQKISELQRELHKSQMQLHLQQTAVLPIESQTVAIPLTNGPQIHIISAPNSEPSIDSSAQKSLQRQLIQQHLQQKLQQNLNIRPQQTNPNETNLATLLTNATISPSVKASLAAFLQSQHQHQQQQQQQQQSLPSPPPPQQTLTTKLITNQSVTPIQQFVLCPSVCAPSETDRSEPDSGKQRTNSLPNGLCHRFLSQTSQRTSSLPNFNTIITSSQSTSEPKHRTEVKPSFIITKCPPNYEEATKQNNKTKDKKKSVKSQAVDDVLEILIKNGELPPSAAQDPTTPTTPEKLLALSEQNSPIFIKNKSLQNSCESKLIESIDKSNDDNNNINNKKSNNNTNNSNNNNNNISNNNNSNNNKTTTGAQNNQTLDFDFILDLEGLAEAMDLNVAINEKSLKVDNKFTNCDKNNIINNNNISNNNDNSFSTQSNRTKNSELSLSEFMDFQDCSLNVEDNHWMEMASTSMPSNEQNLMHYNETDDQNHSNINFDGNNNTNNAHNSIVSPSGVKSETSKHDPILPNTMFGGNLIDPLGDLFFDDTDFKSSLDLGALMWDKVDFAT